MIVYTFHSNEEWLLAEEGKKPIYLKGQGWSIMVSDFINEHGGYSSPSNQEHEEAHLNHSVLGESARFLLEYGSSSEGYWNSKKYLTQVKKTLTIA